MENITEWLAKDEIEEIADEDIVVMVLNEQPIEEEQGDEPSDRSYNPLRRPEGDRDGSGIHWPARRSNTSRHRMFT